MKVTVAGATINRTQLVLYTIEGKTVCLNQGDPRIQPTLEKIQGPLDQGLVVEVDLTLENNYTQFSKKSGLVKFFRVAKDAVKTFFGPKTTQVMGDVSGTPDLAIETKQKVDEIMRHAIPAESPAFDNESPETTVIAVTDEGILDGVEKLERQFANAYKMGSTVGVERFLKRLTAVIKDRRHSVEDLLKFMERGDLPIADDGCIVIYKALNHTGKRGIFADKHSGRVLQKVGSYVFMKESMVDHDRRQECSNGLHVARRGYLSSFHCDTCVIAKVKPEDVIAVPEYDANKMRVCGYHILGELPPNLYQKLLNNQAMTDSPEGRKILGAVLAGNHLGIIQTVEIGGSRGTNLTIIDLDKPIGEATVEDTEAEAEAIDVDKENVKEMGPIVDPKKIAQKINSRQQEAKELFSKIEAADTKEKLIAALNVLQDFKRAKKVSWEKLGLDGTKIKEYQLLAE